MTNIENSNNPKVTVAHTAYGTFRQNNDYFRKMTQQALENNKNCDKKGSGTDKQIYLQRTINYVLAGGVIALVAFTSDDYISNYVGMFPIAILGALAGKNLIQYSVALLELFPQRGKHKNSR